VIIRPGSLVAGTVTKYVLLGFNIAAGAVLMPFTVAHLGRSQYGLWMLVASMTTYFQLLDIGYGNGVVRHLVEADARNDAEEVNCIASTFVVVYTIIGAVALLLTGCLIVWVIPRFPHLSPADVRLARCVVAILALRVAVGFPMTVFGAVTNARQGFVLNNAVAIAVVAANAVITYLVLRAGFGLLGLVAATTAVNALGYTGYAATARHVFPALHISTRRFRADRWREVTAFSIWMFVIDIAVQIGFNIDNLVIGAAMSTAAVATYAVALRLSEYQRRFCDQFSGMLFPVAVSLGARGDTHALRAVMIEGSRVTTLLGGAAMLCLIGFGGPLIRAWMGPGFEDSVGALIALAIASAILVAHAPMNKVLVARGRHRMVAATWIGESLTNLVLSVILVRRFGLTGVAVATALPLAVGHFGILLPAACRAVGLELSTAIRQMFGPALGGVFTGTIAAAIIRVRAGRSASFRLVLVELALTAAVYMVGVLFLGSNRQMRHEHWTHVKTYGQSLAAFLDRQPLTPAGGLEPPGRG
jgi:O-antigen/teichoic acid export membrane protein